MDQAEQDVAVVAQMYQAFERGDIERIFALVAPDATVYQSPALPWGGSYTGHEGLGRFLTALTAHLDSRPQTEQLIADGDGGVVQVGRTRGIVRTNGAPFDVAEAHVWTVRDERIVRFEAYLNTAAMLQALAQPNHQEGVEPA